MTEDHLKSNFKGKYALPDQVDIHNFRLSPNTLPPTRFDGGIGALLKYSMFSWKPRCVQLQSEFLIVIFQGNILSQIYAVSFIPREDYTLEFQESLSHHGGSFVPRRTLCSTSAHCFFMPRHKVADVARMICKETVSLQCKHHCTANKVMVAFISETHSGYSPHLRTPQCR